MAWEMHINLPAKHDGPDLLGPVFAQSYLQPRPWSSAKGTCLHVRPVRLVPVEPFKGP